MFTSEDPCFTGEQKTEKESLWPKMNIKIEKNAKKTPNHETSKKSDLDKWKNYTDTVGVWTFLSSPV